MTDIYFGTILFISVSYSSDAGFPAGASRVLEYAIKAVGDSGHWTYSQG